jgi:hypothetical protein
MLALQHRRVEFSGGLEAKALKDFHVGLLADLTPRPNCFFAYDPGDAFETLKSAADRMLAAGFTRRSHRLRCYVLIGFPKDTFSEADKRLRSMLEIGFTPHAMLWQPTQPAAERYRPKPEWRRFQRAWARPALIHATEAEYVRFNAYQSHPIPRPRCNAVGGVGVQSGHTHDGSQLLPLL